MLVLGRALRLGSFLVTLNLENSGISSRALAILGTHHVRRLSHCARSRSRTSCRRPCYARRRYCFTRCLCGNCLSVLLFVATFECGHKSVLKPSNKFLCSAPLSFTVAALKLNTVLEKLNLSNNKISTKDAIQLGNLLKANNSLQYLDLSDNSIEDAGMP